MNDSVGVTELNSMGGMLVTQNGLVQIGGAISSNILVPKVPARGKSARRPPWMRVKIHHNDTYREVGQLLDGLNLNTVCQEARCPNIWECWGEHKTATFMILGETCTRACRYCSVNSGKPLPPDIAEPAHIAQAVKRLALKYTVITSVDRDDLPDFGADHWVQTITAIRALWDTKIEVLVPDFGDDFAAQMAVLKSGVDIFGHNVETVPRLYKAMRSRGRYEVMLRLLERADTFRKVNHRQHGGHSGQGHMHEKAAKGGVPMGTKSGIMVGLGETMEELIEVFKDLRQVNCDILTIGQYLNPTQKHAPISRFYTPAEFAELKEIALDLGFLHVESGPLVRSSYHAHEAQAQIQLKQR